MGASEKNILDDTIREGIISELKSYKWWKSRVKNLEIDIQEVTQEKEDYEQLGIQKTSVGNPTYRLVDKIMRLTKQKEYWERRCKRVDNALEAMTEVQREIIKLRYFEQHPVKYVYHVMSLTKDPYYDIHNSALWVYAKSAGLVEDK